MASFIRKFFSGIGIVPKVASDATEAGELEVISTDNNRLYYHNGVTSDPLLSADSTDVLENKTIDADDNTILNLENDNIKAGAAIDATKIADGSVDNTEFQALDGITGNIQGQIDDIIDGTTPVAINLNEDNILVGNATNDAVQVDTNAVGDISADATNGLNIKAGVIVDADINASADITRTKLAPGNAYRILANDSAGEVSENAAITAARAVVSDANGQLVASTTTATELGYVNGVTSPIQTQLNAITSAAAGKANVALDNLASVAINTSLISDTNNTDDLGSDAIEWKDVYAHSLSHNDASNPNLNVQTIGNNGSIIATAHGTGNLDIKATKVRRSVNGASTDFMEEQYYDALTLAANTSSPTTISSLTFATASFNVVVLDYMIKEATSNKVRVGTLRVATDGTNVDVTDVYNETALLGSATGLSLSAVVNGANIEIQFDDTHTTNACTMRVLVKRYRA